MKKQSQMSQTGEKSVWHLNEYINILYGLHYGAFGIFCFVCIFGFTVYGKKLTEIVSEGNHMLKATTVWSSENSLEEEMDQLGGLANLDHVERSWKSSIVN